MPLVGTGHMWLLGILLIIVLIIWGPGKLPDVGSGMGRAIREFRKASAEAKTEFSTAMSPAPAVDSAAATPVAATPVEPAPVADPQVVG
jgi:TatA/E family protein of Tat protein translocase